MIDTSDTGSDNTYSGGTPGKILLAARTANNITLEYVCEELRLSRKLIEAIEADQVEGMPEPTYMRGYIRSYARLLGLDEEKVLSRYRVDDAVEEAWAPDIPGDPGKGLVKTGQKPKIASPFTLAASLVILGFLAWFAWDQDWFKFREGSGVPVAVEEDMPASSSIVQTEAAKAAESNIPPAGSSQGSATTNRSTSVATAIPGGPQPLPAVPVQDGEVELTFEFTDTSWVDVRDGTEKRLMFKSYTNGDFEKVSGRPPFQVFIGNANAVKMTYRGEDYDVLPHRNGMYAKFELGQAAVLDEATLPEQGE